MSAHPKRPGDERIIAAARFAARLQGCTCVPWIRLERGRDVNHIHVGHDDDCRHPSMRKGGDA